VVSAWKGVTKSVGVAAMGLAAAAAVVHGIFARPDRVSAEDERMGEALAKGDRPEGGA
jgi:formate dehydrogenase iron-sulfur subunit